MEDKVLQLVFPSHFDGSSVQTLAVEEGRENSSQATGFSIYSLGD